MDRGGRHQGRPGVAPGGAEQDDRPAERPAARDLHPRRRPLPGRAAGPSSRLPAGHPEAFFEAFANIYTAAYADMAGAAHGKPFDAASSLYPNVADGVDGMNFITQCVASSAEGGAWKTLKHPLCRA